METKIWKAKAYLRLSKEDADKENPLEESNSIVNQRDLICDFIEGKADIRLCGERCDDGFSGVSFDRPAFNALMDDIRDGSVDCVIVKDLSRFGRNHIEAGNYIENLFPLLGVRFIAVNDGIDTINPKTVSDNILIPFKNLVNDAYCRDISIKIRSQFAVKRSRGQFVGAFASYGYKKSEENKNKLVIDEAAADYVREIFRRKLSGMSAEAIAKRLNALGIPSPLEYKRIQGENYVTGFKTGAKAKWSATAILRILKNPIYTGTLIQGREGTPNHKVPKKRIKPREEWAVIQECHEPIISTETFDNVQRSLEMDTRTAPDEEHVYLLSGILFCGSCGCSIIRKTVPSGKRKYVYYVCGGNKKNKTCAFHGIREEALTEAVFTAVKKRMEETLDMNRIMEFVDNVAFSKIRVQSLTRQLERKQAEIGQCRRFKKGLYEAYVEQTVSKADYELFYADYALQEKDLGAQAEMLRAQVKAVLSGTDEYGIWIENFKKHRSITELNRAIVLELIDRILIYNKDTIEITLRCQSEYEKLLSALPAASGKKEV
ncbi:MAG: recombinase family protein [Lacrimispora sp.]